MEGKGKEKSVRDRVGQGPASRPSVTKSTMGCDKVQPLGSEHQPSFLSSGLLTSCVILCNYLDSLTCSFFFIFKVCYIVKYAQKDIIAK